MRLFVHYDKKGNIISASKTELLDGSIEHPYGAVAEDDQVLEVEPDAKLDALFCHEIAEQYSVDVKQKKIKKRAPVKSRAGKIKKRAPAKSRAVKTKKRAPVKSGRSNHG